jgi:2-dehydropantoate 2-reductase
VEIAFRSDDVILLTMKTQDTVSALERLRAAGVVEQPIFCVQNGVANERFALRRLPEVHGVTVMMPASHLDPGEVCAFSAPRYGIFDIGRYPAGRNRHDDAVAEVLKLANIAAFVTPDVMPSKYGKLILNLHNILEAALGPDADDRRFDALLRAEAEAVFKATGIAWREVGGSDPRRDQLMRYQPIEGIDRTGGSTTQSLARGGGSIETDYLNGEIVLLGRLHAIPVPANSYLVDVSARMIREKLKPGAVSVAQLEAGLRGAGMALKD